MAMYLMLLTCAVLGPKEADMPVHSYISEEEEIALTTGCLFTSEEVSLERSLISTMEHKMIILIFIRTLMQTDQLVVLDYRI